MRALIFGDVHGDARALGKALGACRADKILLTGDLLEPWQSADEAAAIALLLRAFADRLVAVRGNNDTAVTERRLGLSLPPYATLDFGGKRIFLSHGHLYRAGRLPPLDVPPDVIVTGHTHVPSVSERDGVLLIDPGSVARPRGGGPTFALLDENGAAILPLGD